MAFGNGDSPVTVADTATSILTGREGEGGPDSEQTYKAVVVNAGAQTVYLGGPAVTTANGLPLDAGGSFDLDGIGPDDELFGVVAAGTAEVRVLEVV
jgi:hypothetical protein